MDKLLRLYTYVDGVNDTPFPNSDNPIEIGEFRYDAKRMGGAPTITASVYYPSCLDEVWADNVYAKFNGEKYYLKQVPTSSYSNEDSRYKHDLELVSERVILDNVYFFDTVVGDPQGDDKPISNSTKVVFFGNIHEFVKRLNSSLEYAKLLKWEDGVDDNGNAIKIPKGYYVVVDNNENITTEEKLMSFEDQFFSNVLQEIYNTYGVPYYFEGKTIHIGYSNSNAEIPTFSYGVDNALLSITKNNANYKIVNRATATGSSDNIPFYYPNNSPKGEIAATPSGNFEVKILDTELYSNEIKLDGVIRKSNVEYENAKVGFGGKDNYDGETLSAAMGKGGIDKKCVIEFISKEAGIFLLSFSSSVTKYILEEEEKSDATFRIRYFIEVYDRTANKFTYDSNGNLSSIEDFEVPVPHANHKYEIFIKCYYAVEGKYAGKGGRIEYNATYSFGSKSGWMYEDKVVDLKDVGLEVVGDTVVGDTITQTLVKYIKTSQNLMPSIYRETDGAERLYNAINYPYPKPEGFDNTLLNGYYGEDGILRNCLGEYEVEGYIHNDAYKNEDGTYIHFNNPYVEGRPKEHIFTVEDIKPTIKDTTVGGLRIDMFSEFAYDNDDNDETYEDEEGNVYFKHPYFYGKLRVMDFNLFDHAIEQQPMTISFTSGHCGACNFEIGVTEEYPQKNPVQVDEYGNLVRDENGMVLAGVEGTQQLVTTFQERQQDTSKYEVWIALRKEEETYGILMPQVAHRPKACTEGQNDGDTFVIIGINLPQSYIINAEKKLEAEIIKYLQDNNDDKFTFSIGFSRIYFEENNILDQLSENSKIRIIYDNKPYDLYVSSFSYSMGEGDVLPEIRVELDETLKVSQNALQNAISQVKSELGRAIGSIDVVGAATPYFIRKDTDDEAQGRINFKKGIKFGEGGKVEIMPDNGAKLTIDYLEVTKKATFTSLEIQEKTHAGGQILVTPASLNCGEVEEFEDFYRCYFQTKGESGDEIFNQFAVNDQAICQTFNEWGSRYYWRLVIGVGEDYIDLSKTDCDEGSDIPSAGDKIIQMGNRDNADRQNAIVIAAHGDNSPYIVQYKGISNYDLPNSEDDERITTLLSPTKNILTGQVKMVAGSSGLELFNEWAAKQELIDSKASGEDFNTFKKVVDADIENIKKQVDGAITTWFYDAEPTLENAPAVDWTTDDDKNNHLGDLYYSGAGKAYRFQYDEETTSYYWNPISDEDITKALENAKKAQDTADNKRRVFVVQPTPPYDKGDLWSRGSTLPMMVCVNAKGSNESYDEGDWDFADNTSKLATQIAGYEYIKEAIQNGSTIVTGGLIQSGILMLGYKDADGNYQVMSGTNGVYNANEKGGGIAAWYGGDMSEDSAKTVLRFDGSGFFANKNITWDNEGGASFAGGKITITKEGALVFSDNIAFGSDENETVATVIEKLSSILVHLTELAPIEEWYDNVGTHIFKDEKGVYTKDNFRSFGEVSAGGVGTESEGGGGGGGGSTTLDGLMDVEITEKELDNFQSNSQVIGYDKQKGLWINKVTMYHHKQTQPSAEWKINHGLGKFPNVKIVDTLKQLCLGDVYYVDENNVTIKFGGAESGDAYLD